MKRKSQSCGINVLSKLVWRIKRRQADREIVYLKMPKLKSKKRKSNMEFRDRMSDRWHQFLERIFSKGCYYIGKDIALALLKNADPIMRFDVDVDMSGNSLAVLYARKTESFGLNVDIYLRSGYILAEAIRKVHVLGIPLYFFSPIHVDVGCDTLDSKKDVRIAIGKHSFVDGNTIVFDGHPFITHDFCVFNHLNLPNHIVSVLRSIVFKNYAPVISYPQSSFVKKMENQLWADRSDDLNSGTPDLNPMSELTVHCLSVPIKKILIAKEGVSEWPDENNRLNEEDRKYEIAGDIPRLVGGFVFASGDKIEFADVPYPTMPSCVYEGNTKQDNIKHRVYTLPVKYEGFKLAVGEASFVLPKDKAIRLQKALSALNDNMCLGQIEGLELDELYCTDEVFKAWHRQYDISIPAKYAFETSKPLDYFETEIA